MAKPEHIQEKLRTLPKEPGVYFMKDAKGKIIYVGKAKSLRNRVTSYFNKGDHTFKTRALVAEIADFETMLCQTEKEALLLERTLIRHHQPRYNILLRDDKEYPYIRVQFKDEWPRIEKVRRRKDDGAVYVGPFAAAGVLNFLLRTVYRIFPLIRCSPHQFRTATRPCNYYHIKLCMGPCTLPVRREEYVAMVENALAMLRGSNEAIIERLNAQMGAAAAAENFELAATLRDQVQAIRDLHARQTAVIPDVADADAIGVHEMDGTLACHVLMVRNHHIVGGENYMLGQPVDETAESLASFLLQYYDTRSLPAQVFLPFPIPGQAALRDVLVAGAGGAPLAFATGGSESARELLALARKNAQHHLEQSAQLDANRKVELTLLQESLGLPRLPRRMECIDISNTQGTAIVASNVCFIDARPAKEFYRHYTVKTVTGAPDDFSSIREVVGRRLERGIRDDDLPDLLVIDGGKGQLSAAMDALGAYPDLDLPVVSLAKSRLEKSVSPFQEERGRSDERVCFPDREDVLPLVTGSPQYRVLTAIRDEAHRFAITFHRKKRAEASKKSVLDDVPGVGKVLKTRLIQEFQGLEGLRQATVDELRKVKGMREDLAIRVHAVLHGDGEGDGGTAGDRASASSAEAETAPADTGASDASEGP